MSFPSCESSAGTTRTPLPSREVEKVTYADETVWIDKAHTEGFCGVRYHQLDVVRKLLAAVKDAGAGKRYLIEHSAGSGKSNSIAWLAYQLIGLKRESRPVFDSVIVVTDRLVLDRQIRDTIKQFAQVSSVVGHAEHAGDLRRFLAEGKQIIITVQKFPFILDEIGSEHRGRTFAIIIDEAHSSDNVLPMQSVFVYFAGALRIQP